jgi:hypothetical protein
MATITHNLPEDIHDDAPWPEAPETTHTARATFRATVAEVAARAKAILPAAVNGRVDKAARLVLQHDVRFLDDGTVEVGSSSDPMKVYRLHGTACECRDFTTGTAPDGWCQHRAAAGIAKRVAQVMAHQAQAPQAAAPVVGPQEEAPAAEAVQGIDPRWIVRIQGRPFIRFEGLLALAHERGLVELTTTVVLVTETMAVCQSTARFKDGLVVTDMGDATPANVKAHLKPHFARMSATRAAARALRRALNIDAVSVEELGEE